MKKFILAALALVGLLAIPSSAEARCVGLGLRVRNQVRAVRLNLAVVNHRQNVFAVVNNHHAHAAAIVISNDLVVRRSFLALPLRSYTEVEQVVVAQGYSSGYGSATSDLAYELRRDREDRERLRLEQRAPVASKCDEQISALRSEMAALKAELRK